MSFPDALCELMEMPLAISAYVGIDQKEKVDRGRFESAWYTLLSNLYDKSRAEIEEREKKRRATQRRIKASVVATIIAAIGASALFYWNSEENRRMADSRKLAKQSEGWIDRRIDRALLLSVAAYREKPTFEARSALLRTLQKNLFIVRFLHGHSAAVSSLSFSPSGDILASGGLDNKIYLWETGSWSPAAPPFVAHQDKVASVAFSPDGKMLASAGHDKKIFLWDVALRRQDGKPLDGHDYVVESVAFSRRHGCDILVSGDWGGWLKIWDLKHRSQVGEGLHESDSDINGVVVTPDCSLVIAGDVAGKLTFWDIAMGKIVGKPWLGHPDGIAAIAISEDGSFIASGGIGDGIILRWDVARMRVKQPLERITDEVDIVDGPGNYQSFLPVLSLAFSHDSQLLAVGRDAAEGNTQIFQYGEKAPAKPIGYADATYSVAFHPTKRILASGTRDGTIVIRDFSDEILAVGSSLGVLLPPANDATTGSKMPAYMESLVFGPDGRTLIVGQGNGRLMSWNFDTQQWQLFGILDNVDQRYSHQSLALSPDGRILASFGRDDTIKLWDVSTRRIVGVLPHPTGIWSGSLAFSPDGKTLAALSQNEEISLWDVAQRKSGKTLKLADMGLKGAFDSDGLKSLERLGISGAIPKGTLNTNLVFSHDGTTLVASMGDRRIVVLDLKNLEQREKPIIAPLSVKSVAISPDGTMVAIALVNDGDIMFWYLSKAESVRERIKGAHASRVAFSPDGSVLASVSQNGHVVTLWDVHTREKLGDLGYRLATDTSTDEGTAVVFSPDGKRLASAISSGQLVIWDIDIDSWLQRACTVANRNMTCDEWQEWRSGQTYKKVCPNLPAPRKCDKAHSITTGWKPVG